MVRDLLGLPNSSYQGLPDLSQRILLEDYESSGQKSRHQVDEYTVWPPQLLNVHMFWLEPPPNFTSSRNLV